MTDSERLAAIEANLFRFPTSFNDVRWLVAEVRRLQGAIVDIGKQSNDIILKMTNDAIERADDEYARGRADERRDAVAYLNRADRASGLAKDIEFCEHLERSDAK